MVRLDKAKQSKLVKLAQRGDTEAFGELVKNHQRAVFNIAYRLTYNREEAEDVAQEAFVRAFQAIKRFDTDRPFGPWVFRIATNTALNLIKRRHPEVDIDKVTVIADPSPAPDERAIAAERSTMIRAAVAALPPNYRAAIELRHFQGLSYREMSEELGAPLSDVKSWLFRARRKLQDMLEEISEE